MVIYNESVAKNKRRESRELNLIVFFRYMKEIQLAAISQIWWLMMTTMMVMVKDTCIAPPILTIMDYCIQ